ncbi:glycosyltransferase family 4 protein [Primorskyibacter sp. S187A]|uniref:glycosyltransferase family 4 protein n=1 Tax=Primorskyibacter sp. S187A TaxID=3415130 RepID=UPI003C7B5652
MPNTVSPDCPKGKQRRILFLRNSRGITDITGAETYLINVISGLRRAGHEVMLLTADMSTKGETPWVRALTDRQIPHEIVDVPSKFSLADMRAAMRLVKEFKPDVLHAMDHRSDAVAVWTAARTGLPAVASFFGWTNWAKTTLRGRLYPIFDRLVMRRLKRVIVDSAYVGEQIRSANANVQVAVIQNGVDLERFDPTRVSGGYKNQWFGAEDVFCVGMIGRLHPNKGHADMAEAAAQLVEKHPELRFVVLGDPPTGYEEFADDLRARLRALGLTEHFVITNVPSSEIPRAIASFDVTALPSYMESLSYVMLESMAMHKPVASARVGGHGELISHGENGLLFEPGDISAMVDLIDQLVSDPDAASRMGRAGFETMRDRYSTDAMIARTCAVYDEVIS